MKPEKLKYPFLGEERRIQIIDKVWYLPTYENLEFEKKESRSFSFPGWYHPEVFSRELPIKIEYCSGNGGWIAERAQKEKDINWVAIEKKFVRARKIWSKIKNYELDNLFVICGEGFLATRHYFPSDSVQEVFINFPDPWPKRRHANFRIVQTPFIREMQRILKQDGLLTMVTDDKDYSAAMIKVLLDCDGFDSVYPSPYFVTDNEDYGTSYFEDLWRQKGKEIYYHQFKKA